MPVTIPSAALRQMSEEGRRWYCRASALKGDTAVEKQLALIADSANISVEGKLNILGEFDTLFAEVVPVRHPTLWFVAKLLLDSRDVGEKRFMLRLVDEDGNTVLPPLTMKVTIPQPGPAFTGDRQALPIVLMVSDATFPKFGAYLFELRVDEQVIAEVPLHVRSVQALGKAD